jgi:phage terminase small subunit
MSEQPPTTEDELTPKEQLFVAHYLGEARGNGTKAMRLAGYKGNANTLAVGASQNLRKPKIAAAIEQGLADIMPKAEVLHILADQARPDRNSLANFFRIEEEERIVSRIETIEEVEIPQGSKKARPNVTEIKRTITTETARRPVVLLDLARAKKLGVLHLAKSYRETDKGVSVELYDSQAAAKQIGNFHGMWTERQEITGKDGGPVEVNVSDARERLLERITRRIAAASAGRDQSGDPGA